MILRDFVPSDAEKIVEWIECEREFYYWSADHYGHYPIVPDEIVANYKRSAEKTFFKPMIVQAEDLAVGHFILRTPLSDRAVIRIGFVIVDKTMRGKGVGKELITEAVRYAKDVLCAKEVNLGVFEQNLSAINCYKKAGFEIVGTDDETSSFDYLGETWKYLKMIYRGE